ncbi:hypothetical protein AB0P16_11680 [Dietzia maris]|uniref:hypothetical protein n=1 Tax=Dietzia TaxID=37914 RepID=UPI0011783C31|nr:hypothetical protein [Dietzia sp. WMMA184]
MKRWFITTLIAVGVLFLGIGLAIGVLKTHGWVAEWVAAAGQVAGAAATAAAVFWAAATFVIQQKDLRKQRDAERAAAIEREGLEASKVWSWVTVDDPRNSGADGEPLTYVVVVVRNRLDRDVWIESAVPVALPYRDAPVTKARLAPNRDKAFKFPLKHHIPEGDWSNEMTDIGGSVESCLKGAEALTVYRIGEKQFQRQGVNAPVRS